MKYVADVHIHSHYSRATSKNLNFEHLSKWAQQKGVQVVGTGDIAHPGWLQEMRDKLEPAEEGLFRLKKDYAEAVQKEIPRACRGTVRFMLAGEISSIYKKNDKVRKVHNIIFAPSLESVEKIQAALEKIGNIRSDGRPILGLDSRDLLEIILDIDEQNYLIPAHIWTPWFSLLGSKSGFDSVEECFDDLTPYIFALETGLSSDPPMNWRVSTLDKYTLVSNSDAHSPQKLAREANVFDTDLSYPAIFESLKSGDPNTFLGTLEFFPEEGKYHLDGHRKCGVCWNPKTTLEHNGLCSKCGKPVTVGVSHRVEVLADREEGERPARTHPFQSLIPLPEVLSEVHQVGSNSKRVKQHYDLLLAKLGPELSILQDTPLEAIAQVGGVFLAEGIRRMRNGEITPAGGFDGEFGTIKLFEDHERDVFAGQLSFFAAPEKVETLVLSNELPVLPKKSAPARTDTDKPQQETLLTPDVSVILSGLNPQQREAVLCINAPLIITAGPGTGKTRTLTRRIAYLITEKNVAPENILAITFTNKAAEEMAVRLADSLGSDVSSQIMIKTFHAFGATILRAEGEKLGEKLGVSSNFSICGEGDRRSLLKKACPDLGEREVNQYLEQISSAKNQLLTPDATQIRTDPEFVNIYQSYESALHDNQMLDFDDLILRVVVLFETTPETLATYQYLLQWISVDEYQDINFAQYRLLKLLAGAGANMCVIGDPDQAIYGFRGASREYFLRFTEDFPAAKVIHLNQNYRSPQLLLDASGQVIAKNADTNRVKIWSEFVDKTKVEIHQSSTHKAEAEYVVHQIESLIGGTSYFSLDSGRVDDDSVSRWSFADFAVLYRLGAQSQPLIEAFQRSGIPFQTVGQMSLYEYKEIKERLAYLWFVYNSASRHHLEIIFGDKNSGALDKLAAYAENDELSLWEALQQFETLPFFRASQRRQLNKLVSFLNNLKIAAQTQPVKDLVVQVDEFLPDADTEQAAERVQQLILMAAAFEHRLPEFLEATALQKETDTYDPRADRVTLMTLHASKGLEFPIVFIVGCEENLIPYQRKDEAADIEEERRLFYVGMTRAQQKLVLIHAKSRFLFGHPQNNPVSRFVEDIEDALKEVKKAVVQKAVKEKPNSTQLTLF